MYIARGDNVNVSHTSVVVVKVAMFRVCFQLFACYVGFLIL